MESLQITVDCLSSTWGGWGKGGGRVGGVCFEGGSFSYEVFYCGDDSLFSLKHWQKLVSRKEGRPGEGGREGGGVFSSLCFPHS